ncbi:MAG: polysaccharide deacetylase family protein [Pseudomonadota bacterium]|nr:polysaccharide deacetylase family protein [Pseudomonadota bacterium]
MTGQSNPVRRWSPTPLLYATGAVHLGAAAASLLQPGVWPWAVGAVAANHGVLAGAGLWPRSQLLGPNLIQLPAGASASVAITIDDGPDPDVTPPVLALLAEHRALATFFCVGERVERYPRLAQEIVRQGHSMENHSQRHRHNFSLLGPHGMRTEISRAQDGITRVTGSPPRFFRAPAGLRNPFLEPVLARLQLRLASWTRRGFDTVNGDADTVYQRLTHSLHGGDILLLHDGNSARDRHGYPVILDVLPRLLDTLRSRRLSPITLRAALES